MPAFEASSQSREWVSLSLEDAQAALERVNAEKEQHRLANQAARKILSHHGVYREGMYRAVTHWVLNPELDDGVKRTSYQLRTPEESPEHAGQGIYSKIFLAVRLSTRNPIGRGALITDDEVRSIINSPVYFVAGDYGKDDYVQIEGTGIESVRAPVDHIRERLPVVATPSEGNLFRDTLDTLSIIEKGLAEG